MLTSIIWAAGSFSTINGVDIPYFAGYIPANNTWISNPGQFNDIVNFVTAFDTNVFAQGEFTTVNGSFISNGTAYSTDMGTTWSGANFISSNQTIVGSSSTGLYLTTPLSGSSVTLEFLTYPGLTLSPIVVINGPVSQVVSNSIGTLYVVGLFSQIGIYQVVNSAVSYDNGKTWIANIATNNIITSYTVANYGTILTGSFTRVGIGSVNYVAAQQAGSLSWYELASPISGGTVTSSAIDIYGNTYLGGSFTSLGSGSAQYLAISPNNGITWTNLGNPNGPINSIAIQQGYQDVFGDLTISNLTVTNSAIFYNRPYILGIPGDNRVATLADIMNEGEVALEFIQGCTVVSNSAFPSSGVLLFKLNVNNGEGTILFGDDGGLYNLIYNSSDLGMGLPVNISDIMTLDVVNLGSSFPSSGIYLYKLSAITGNAGLLLGDDSNSYSIPFSNSFSGIVFPDIIDGMLVTTISSSSVINDSPSGAACFRANSTNSANIAALLLGDDGNLYELPVV